MGRDTFYTFRDDSSGHTKTHATPRQGDKTGQCYKTFFVISYEFFRHDTIVKRDTWIHSRNQRQS